MAEGFEIAQGYVSVVAEIERDGLQRSATTVGKQAGETLGEGISRGMDGRLRDARGRFASAGNMSGESFSSGFGSVTRSFGMHLPKMFMNPYVLAGIAAAGVAMAPPLMAGLSGALIGGAGLGVIGLGAFLLREEPALKAASTRLGKTVSTVFKGAAKPMLQPFVNSIGMIEAMMKRIEPSIKRAFAGVAPAIEPLTKGLTSMVEKAMPGLLKLVEASGPFLRDMAPGFTKLGEGISIFSREIAKAGPDAALFFKDLLVGLGGFIAGLGTFIGWVARGYGEWRNFMNTVGLTTRSAISSILGFAAGVGSAISTVVTWLTTAYGWFSALPGRIAGFVTAIPGILRNAFVSAFQQATFAIGYGIGTVMGFFISLPGRVRGAIMGVVTAIASVFNSARSTAINATTNLVNGVINFFRTLPGRARAAISSLWGSMVGAFNSARSGSLSSSGSLVNGVINFFRQLPGRARGAVAGLWGSMAGAFNSARSAAINAANSLVNGAINTLRQLPGRARSAVGGVRGAIMGAFGGAGGWLVGAGASIIQGLIGGIRSMIGAAVGAAISGMKSIISGAKSALGIGSPSKVFDREVGRWLFPGVVRGVKRTLPAAQRAVAAATASLVPGLRPASASISGAATGVTTGGGGIHIGSITLDASNMKSIQDVVTLIEGLNTSARTARSRGIPRVGV